MSYIPNKARAGAIWEAIERDKRAELNASLEVFRNQLDLFPNSVLEGCVGTGLRETKQAQPVSVELFCRWCSEDACDLECTCSQLKLFPDEKSNS